MEVVSASECLRFVLRFDRPQIQRTTTSVNQFITTLNTTINGGRKHIAESRKTDAGKVLRNTQGDEEYRYNDIAIPSQGDTIRNLHPFPISPFPGTNEHLSGLTQTLLRKRLEPTEEKWVEDRLAKALEFAYVPPEWGIEPRKPVEKECKDNDTESGDVKPDDDGKPKTPFEKYNKRSKGTLTEKELVKRWNKAHRKFFGRPGAISGEGDEEYTSDEGEEEEEEEEEEEFEDAMDEDEPAQAAQEEEAKPKTPPPVVVIQEAESPVHKPVPGMPVMEVGVSLKFIATGQL